MKFSKNYKFIWTLELKNFPISILIILKIAQKNCPLGALFVI